MAGGRRAQRQSRSAGLLVTHQSLLPSFLPSFCILCLLVFTSTILSTGIVQNSVRLPKKVSSLPCMMMHAKTVLLVLHVDRSSNLQSFCTACLHVHTLCVCVCVCVCVRITYAPSRVSSRCHDVGPHTSHMRACSPGGAATGPEADSTSTTHRLASYEDDGGTAELFKVRAHTHSLTQL